MENERKLYGKEDVRTPIDYWITFEWLYKSLLFIGATLSDGKRK